MTDFHGRIMNVQKSQTATIDTYAIGHRDARHACAEIALEADAEIERLRLWVVAIGSLPDLDADNRSWMAEHALNGRRPPDRVTHEEAK